MWKTLMIQGWRNLRRNARRTAITMAVIIGGLVTMILSFGLIEGYIPQMIEANARSLNGHILIHKRGYFQQKSLDLLLQDPARIERWLAQDKRVEAWSRRLIARGLLGSAESVQGIKLLGVDPTQDRRIIKLYQKLIKGRAPRRTHQAKRATDRIVEVMIGKKIAEKLKVEIGSKVVLKIGRVGGGATDAPMRVSGIFWTGSPGFDSFYIVAHYDEVARLLHAPNRAHQIAIRVKKLEDVKPVAAALQKQLGGNQGGFEVLPWWKSSPEMKAMIKLTKISIWFILLLIFPIVMLGCLNTMLMSAFERSREIGIMKAIGTKPSQIIALFFWEGIFLSLLGATIGALLGTALNYYLQTHGGISLKAMMSDDVKIMVSGIAMEPVMQVKVTAGSIIWPTLTVIVSTIIASLYPAWKVSKLEPTKAIQYQ